jgi:hypothetical protein
MHILVRIIRTASFLAVVIPNARSPRCYADRFPPVPQGMWNYIVTGYKSIRGGGGCNDLIMRCALAVDADWCDAFLGIDNESAPWSTCCVASALPH